MKRISAGCGSIVLLLAGGCHSANTTSFKVVDPVRIDGPTDASKLKIEKERSVFIDAKPIGGLGNPAFPGGKLPPGPVTITVRVAVDEEGRASVLGKSLSDLSASTPFAAACDRMISQAVAEWKFEPAQIALLEPQQDGRPLLVSSRVTDTTSEVAFTFTPSGDVGSQLNPK
jgi:hypothetical protein